MVKTVGIIIVSLFLFTSCKKEGVPKSAVIPEAQQVSFDSTEIAGFYKKYEKFNEFEPELKELYNRRKFHFIWYDQSGRTDFAEVLYNRINQIKSDGVLIDVPYKKQIDSIFQNSEGKKATVASDLLISSMYFFYTKNVLQGIDSKKSKETGWYLPREKMSFVTYLDTLLNNPYLIKRDKSEMIGQYYLLKKTLAKYRKIEEKGGWSSIDIPEKYKSLKVGDSSKIIQQVRQRLFEGGELAQNSNSSVYDVQLEEVVKNHELRYRRKSNSDISLKFLKELNVPVSERIKTIIVNMERCRWISPEVMESPELIAVNVPSFRMQYIKDKKTVLESNVVVGKELNETVIFSGQMSYLVFSPYWNVPRSIIEKEIKPAIKANENYLAKHNMEWNNGNIRQKPGPNNSLGLVKFMFPNSNNIYLHDTPAKSLFNKDDRALSHGCVRVEKARELAIAILKDDPNWSVEKIDKSMKAGTEKSYTLKRKIPVYIGYFTAWVDASGEIAFYEDIYNKDKRLASMLYLEEK